MRASQVFDQLPVCYCATCWSIFVHCCVCMSVSAWLTVHIECVYYNLYLGGLGWDLNSSHAQT